MKIIILGDIMIDINHHCNTTRTAPEANIPVYNVLKTEYIFGGAANVAKNLRILDCQVEIIEARVRRYRMGYIELTCPVTHLWYLKGVPSYLCILLKCFDEKITTARIEQVVYFKEGARFIDESHPLYYFFEQSTDIKKNELKPFFTNSNEKIGKTYITHKRKGSEIIKAALIR
jgi:DNA-directed RNA polymerase beta' subunit